MKKIIIVAVAANGIIGSGERKIPWHIPEDFKHFKRTTMGHTLIMGRNTFLSLGKPLPGRKFLVISREPFDSGYPDIPVFSTPEEALAACEQMKLEQVFIAGGGELYRYALEKGLVDEMIISHIQFEAEGDVPFPAFVAADWQIVQEEKYEQFTVVYYKRANA